MLKQGKATNNRSSIFVMRKKPIPGDFLIGAIRLFLQIPLVTIKARMKEVIKIGRQKTKYGKHMITTVFLEMKTWKNPSSKSSKCLMD